MTNTEFLAILKELGWTQARFCRITGYSTRHVNRWARGTDTPPKDLQRLLRWWRFRPEGAHSFAAWVARNGRPN